MATPTPALLVCDCVSWRLDLFEKALDRITAAARKWERLADVKVGYRSRDDIAFLAVESGLLAEQRLGVLAASAAALPGLRTLDLPPDGPNPSEVRDRLFASCDLVTNALAVSEAVTRIRRSLGMTDDRRRTLRVAVEIGCRYETAGGWIEATARDLSSSGLFVETRAFTPDIGDRTRIELFHGTEHPVTVQGEVVRHSPNGFGARLFLDEESQRLIYDRVHVLRPSLHDRNARIPVHLDVSFLLGGKEHHEEVENLSPRGAFIRAEHAPEPGTTVDLALRLPEGQSLTLGADVVRRKNGGFGVAFRGLGEKTSAQLDRFITDSLTRPYARLLVGVGADSKAIAADLGRRRCETIIADDAQTLFGQLVDELLSLDLLLIGEGLPGASAAEMLNRIRRVGGELDLPVAIVSAQANRDREMLMEAGATAVMPAISPEALGAKCLELIMARRRMAGGRA